MNKRRCWAVWVGVLAGMACLCCSQAAVAEKTLIRSFVNGFTEKKVHDLHIVFNQDLRRVSMVSSQQASVKVEGRRTVDIEFKEALKPNETVSVLARTRADELGIEEWWWTDEDHQTLAREVTYVDRRGSTAEGTIDKYPGHLRGDEAQLPYPLPEDGLDPYAILNKRHHWGGTARRERKICVELDVRHLLEDPPDGLDAEKLLENVRAAAKQWSSCSDLRKNRRVPRANGDNENHGAEVWLDPPTMAPGPSHEGANGVTFRSVTDRECDAALLKYPRGIRIETITNDDDDGCARERDGRIEVGWGETPGEALGYGPSTADDDDPELTASGSIALRRRPPQGRSWSTSEDTDEDGWITNEDEGIPEDSYDFYSVFKHELGHVLCFSHAGSNYFEEAEEARFKRPEPLQPSLPGDPWSPFPTAVGDADTWSHEWILFSAELSGGHGGLDLWRAERTGDGWDLVNLGPLVNSPADDTEPVLGSDGTTLIFSSNRLEQAGYALFEASLDVVRQTWSEAKPVSWSVESAALERHPTLTADMRTLYFASDDSAGVGGWDLWAAEWVEGRGWSQPFVLGETVNTGADEIEPSISGDGRALYFATNRPGGAGGWDLWRAALLNGWQTAVALTEQNSAADERSPAVRLDDAFLFFRSTRDGEDAVYTAARKTPRQGRPGEGEELRIAIEKTTNAEDADEAPGPRIPVGDPVVWSYRVANTGGFALTNVTVTDSRLGAVGCPKNDLEPGESMVCEAKGAAEGGQYENVGRATADVPVGPPASNEDPSHYFGVPPFDDCNRNLVPDEEDIATGTSSDINDNRVPDECEMGRAVWRFLGEAEGGEIIVTIEGFASLCTVTLVTSSGQTASEVANTLAMELEGDACLASQGFQAEAPGGGRVVLTGVGLSQSDVTETVADPGLVHDVPTLAIPAVSTVGLLGLALLLGAAGSLMLLRC